ncbi:tail fiber assembly protein [Pseudomonas proteolytica]|uniref:tail fiber assembly protein n=1 Tax=Pseudomonas proteolytica TaxID=219574 RepID=UPI0017C1E888|nr:tail fiber assembly protein [Pseudomonas proteolytica]NMZ00142.1 tail fiber assembly protein [Pseudomonas proteolytica]
MIAKVSDLIEQENPDAYLPKIENIQRRADGTYVIAYGGAPYHATKDVTPDVYDRVLVKIEGGAVVTDYVEPEVSKPDPLAEAVDEYNRLRKAADFTIAPLQDAADLGAATQSELHSLSAWKMYRIALSRVQTQQGYPQSIEWPVAPA